MRFGALVSVVLLAACAPSGTSGSSAAPAPTAQTVLVGGGGGGRAELRLAGISSLTSTVPFAPDKVWLVLPAVFDSLGVSVATLEPTKRLIGNQSFKVRSRLKSVPLSRYIDCGNSG